MANQLLLFFKHTLENETFSMGFDALEKSDYDQCLEDEIAENED